MTTKDDDPYDAEPAFDPNYGLGPEPSEFQTDLDQMTTEQLEKVADMMAARLDLAVVQRVPQQLLEMMYDGTQHDYPLSGMIGPAYVLLRFVRRGNVLEFSFWANGQTVATFRFAGDHILGSHS